MRKYELKKKFWEELISRFPFTTRWVLDTMRIVTENTSSKRSSSVACINCSGNVFTEQLPRNIRRDTETQETKWYHKYAFIFETIKSKKKAVA
jgi:hypothetical protein